MANWPGRTGRTVRSVPKRVALGYLQLQGLEDASAEFVNPKRHAERSKLFRLESILLQHCYIQDCVPETR